MGEQTISVLFSGWDYTGAYDDSQVLGPARYLSEIVKQLEKNKQKQIFKRFIVLVYVKTDTHPAFFQIFAHACNTTFSEVLRSLTNAGNITAMFGIRPPKRSFKPIYDSLHGRKWMGRRFLLQHIQSHKETVCKENVALWSGLFRDLQDFNDKVAGERRVKQEFFQIAAAAKNWRAFERGSIPDSENVHLEFPLEIDISRLGGGFVFAGKMFVLDEEKYMQDFLDKAKKRGPVLGGMKLSGFPDFWFKSIDGHHILNEHITPEHLVNYCESPAAEPSVGEKRKAASLSSASGTNDAADTLLIMKRPCVANEETPVPQEELGGTWQDQVHDLDDMRLRLHHVQDQVMQQMDDVRLRLHHVQDQVESVKDQMMNVGSVEEQFAKMVTGPEGDRLMRMFCERITLRVVHNNKESWLAFQK
jgi:hypothetical protein